MHHTQLNSIINRSVLASLRAVGPRRDFSFMEALRTAELQACRLLELWDINEAFVPSEIVSELPRVKIIYEDLPVSGTSHWSGKHWIIALNRYDPWNRKRFTLLHEFKHIIDHGHVQQLYTGSRTQSSAEQAELAADYFAGCALVPKRFLKRAWGDGIQRPSDLAQLFKVSVQAINVRLHQTGLNMESDLARCARPISSPRGPRLRTINERLA